MRQAQGAVGDQFILSLYECSSLIKNNLFLFNHVVKQLSEHSFIS